MFRLKNVILKIHLWLGLAAGLFLLAIGLSGALLVFENQIDRLQYPALTHVTPGSQTLTLSELSTIVERAYPGSHVEGFNFAQADDEPHIVFIADKNVAINQYTGRILGVLPDKRFTRSLHGFHTHLLAGNFGNNVVGWCSIVLAILGFSGLLLWWPRKTFGFSFQSSGTKFHFNAHNTIGICSSVALLLFALTGVAIYMERPVNQLASRLAHVAPQRIPKPSPPASGRSPLVADQLVAIAQTVAPGALVTRLDLPDKADAPARVILKYPEDRTPAGRTHVYIDTNSGAVLSFTDARTMPLLLQYVGRVNREIHTGDVYGWPTRILAALFSLALPLLAITGSLLWWNRRPARSNTRTKSVAA